MYRYIWAASIGAEHKQTKNVFHTVVPFQSDSKIEHEALRFVYSDIIEEIYPPENYHKYTAVVEMIEEAWIKEAATQM